MSVHRRANDYLARAAVAIGLGALAFSQKPGLVVADTKLDLVISPGAFLARSLHAWDAQAGFGQLQNQAYGYLFPMGPFFWLGQALGLPVWVVQRAWWAVLLVVAFVGFLKLCDVLSVGSSWSRLVGALAYALGPRLLTIIGPISVESLPLVLLPWVLLPLIHGSSRGSPRRAAALSGLAIACIGGVNAAATLAVLVVPALWLVTRAAGPRRRALMSWWALSTILAISWWLLPLLVLGRYAFPFLDAIESSRTTTSVTQLSDVLRGADHWIAYLVTDDRVTWKAGWLIATQPAVAAATAGIALLGLWGIAMKKAPERTFLGLTVLAGALLVAIGYSGRAGSPVAGPVQGLLDGPLAAFRNVHKFDPVLRLPLTLGFTLALAVVPTGVQRQVERMRGEDGAWLQAHPKLAPGIAMLGALVLLAVSTVPAWSGRLPNEGAFEKVPVWWGEAADWLGRQDGRTLLEPASGFGEYSWGRPWDEPYQALAQKPWAVRGAVPLGAPGLTRLLDAIEVDISSGRPTPQLAPALRRMGVRYVLLRNDLAASATATPPAVARATLAHSSGLSLVAGFGPRVSVTFAGAPSDTEGESVQTLEVFEVAGSNVDPGVSVYSAASVGFTGGPEALLQAAPVQGAWVATVDGESSRVLVTDTLRRRQLNVGADVTRNYSETLDAWVAEMGGRPIDDINPYGAAEPTPTVVVLNGDTRAWVSSSSTDPFLWSYRGPVGGPYAVLDGSVRTSWIAAPDDREPTWTLESRRSLAIGDVVLNFSGLPPDVARPMSVTVQTDAGTSTTAIVNDVVRVPVSDTKRLKLTLQPDPRDKREVGLSELTLAGVDLTPMIAVPGVPAAADSEGWNFEADPVTRRSCVRPVSAWLCAPGLSHQGADAADLVRRFSVTEVLRSTVTAEAIPRPGPVLDDLLDGALGYQASASSTRFVDPAARPGAAFDGDRDTAWRPGGGDSSPTVSLAVGQEATLTGIAVQTNDAGAARLASAVVRSESGEMRVADLARDGAVTFDALKGRYFDIVFRLKGTPPFDLEVKEISLTGLPTPIASPVELPCGVGPELTIDGNRLSTSVRASVSRLVSGSAVPVTVCGNSWRGSQGEHRLVGSSSGAFVLTHVSLTPDGTTRGVEAPQGAVVTRWTDEARELRLTGAEGARILATAESFNVGWRATLAGHVLEPLRIDGWRQGWLVQAGSSGVVELEYRPGRLHRGGLLVGAVFLLALLVLVAVPVRRRSSDGARTAAESSGPLSVASVVVAALLAGLWGLACWPVARWLAPAGSKPWWVVGAVWVLGVGAVRLQAWPDAAREPMLLFLQLSAVYLLVSAALGSGQSGRTGGPAQG